MIYYIKPWIYPIIISVEMICSVIITYLKSTNDGHAEKDFPYISDTGNKGVSASVFSLLFNIYGFLEKKCSAKVTNGLKILTKSLNNDESQQEREHSTPEDSDIDESSQAQDGLINTDWRVFINVSIRFEQVKETYNYNGHRLIFLTNIGSLSVGLIACLGVFLGSNFQIDTLRSVHDAGAVMAFGFGTVYFGMQSIISFFMTKLPGRNTITNVIRVIMSVLQTAFLVGTYVMMRQYSNSKDRADKRKAAILEWILVLLITVYWCTFIQEFYQYNWKIQLERINRLDINN